MPTDTMDVLLTNKAPKEKLKWYQKLSFSMVALPIALFAVHLNQRNQEKKELRKKMRYFNPIIREGFWGNTTTWVCRDKPLTDDELEKLFE